MQIFQFIKMDCDAIFWFITFLYIWMSKLLLRTIICLQAELYAADGYVREVYVFKNENDPFCPVILHFPLVNQNFRTFKAPGKYNWCIVSKYLVQTLIKGKFTF